MAFLVSSNEVDCYEGQVLIVLIMSQEDYRSKIVFDGYLMPKEKTSTLMY